VCARGRCPGRRRSRTGAGASGGGRRCGQGAEPIYSIAAQRFVDAVEGRGLADVENDMAADAKSRAGGRPSMLQDVMKRRRTEVEYLNGYVVEQGRRVGVKTPFNEKVVDIIRALGVGFRSDIKHLDPLAALLPR